MDAKFQEVRDPKTNRLSCKCCKKDGIIEIRQKGRTMQIKVPPGTTIEFIFNDSDPAA